MHINLDGMCEFYTHNNETIYDDISTKLSYNKQEKAFRGIKSYIDFSKDFDVNHIHIEGSKSLFNSTPLIKFNKLDVKLIQNESVLDGFVAEINYNAKVESIDLYKDKLIANTSAGISISLRADTEAMLSKYPCPDKLADGSTLWNFNNNTLNKLITEKKDYYTVYVWGDFSTLGLKVGRLMRLDELLNNQYFDNKTDSEIVLSYEDIAILAVASFIEEKYVLIHSLTFDIDK